jgi:NitT/TauT family transport system ATP-binding protein
VVSAAVQLPAAKSVAALALDVRGVSQRFALKGQTLTAIENVSFRVEPGEFVALLGPSGCGKSTLLRLIAGLDLPSAGQVLGDGVVITAPHPSRVIMFQDPTLYPWRTVRANAALGLEARGQLRSHGARVDEALVLVGLTGFETAYPHQLSGGMAQRVALARALVNDPRLLTLDEPLGKLDSLTRLTMQRELVQLWQREGFTVIMVTHDVEEALLMANRVIVFTDRPARVKATLTVDLSYPRHRDDPRLVALRREALELLGLPT